MKDGKEYFEDHLNTDQLVLRNLHDEAKDTVKDIKKISKELQKRVESIKKKKENLNKRGSLQQQQQKRMIDICGQVLSSGEGRNRMGK